MNPFLEIPIGIVNIDKEEKITQCRIKPGQIEYYYPGLNNGTCIIMQSGHSIYTPLTFGEIDDALTSYVECVKKNNGKFGNVLVTKRKVDAMPLKAVKDEPETEPVKP